MGQGSNDADEGLVLSLAIYLAAIAAAILLLLTPVYLLTRPMQFENHGMAAYVAPPGTRVLPARAPGNAAALGAVSATRMSAMRPAAGASSIP